MEGENVLEHLFRKGHAQMVVVIKWDSRAGRYDRHRKACRSMISNCSI